MRPEVISGWPLHSYGLMLVVGFYTAYFLLRWAAKREGLDPKWMVDMLLIAAALGIVGARVFYVIQYGDRVRGFLDFFAIWRGGLVFYGGLVAATAGLVVYVKVKKLPTWKVADAAAPAVMIGLAFGRVGCFLNGCCWGAVCEESFPLAVRFPRLTASAADGGCRRASGGHVAVEPDGKWHLTVISGAPPRVDSREKLIKYVKARPEAWRKMSLQWSRATKTADGTVKQETITGSPAFLQHLAEHPGKLGPDEMKSLPVHPTQLYSSFAGFVMCGALLLRRRWRRRPGEVFALMACLYAVTRFCIEGLRHDTNPVLAGLTIAQTISIALFAAGLAGLVFCRLRPKG
ncbi:MAG: prolipoprotein diacylglyceryl transferase [Planctomycetota bacterium]